MMVKTNRSRVVALVSRTRTSRHFTDKQRQFEMQPIFKMFIRPEDRRVIIPLINRSLYTPPNPIAYCLAQPTMNRLPVSDHLIGFMCPSYSQMTLGTTLSSVWLQLFCLMCIHSLPQTSFAFKRGNLNPYEPPHFFR